MHARAQPYLISPRKLGVARCCGTGWVGPPWTDEVRVSWKRAERFEQCSKRAERFEQYSKHFGPCSEKIFMLMLTIGANMLRSASVCSLSPGRPPTLVSKTTALFSAATLPRPRLSTTLGKITTSLGWNEFLMGCIPECRYKYFHTEIICRKQ